MSLLDTMLDHPGRWVTALIAALLLFIFSMDLLGSYNEARVYNKLTGAKVTTWDAMWVELRVDCP